MYALTCMLDLYGATFHGHIPLISTWGLDKSELKICCLKFWTIFKLCHELRLYILRTLCYGVAHVWTVKKHRASSISSMCRD